MIHTVHVDWTIIVFELVEWSRRRVVRGVVLRHCRAHDQRQSGLTRKRRHQRSRRSKLSNRLWCLDREAWADAERCWRSVDERNWTLAARTVSE